MSGNPPVFALLTDFGLTDPYVGQLKAALFSRAPSVPILDISHGVPPFAVMTGAFYLHASRPYFPPGTIFVCVVDPGVGSGRKLLCLAGGRHTLIGPDNGLLSLAYRDMTREGPVSAHALREDAPDGGDVPSATFHGRDILAPAAAAISAGTDIAAIALPLEEDPLLPEWAEADHAPGEIRCTVLHVDRFGNCILNLRNNDELLLYPRLYVSVGKAGAPENIALRQVGHYAELPKGEPGILPGGQGFYELALAGASAAALLRLAPGDTCTIKGDLWSKA